jgi:hypothetical protein
MWVYLLICKTTSELNIIPSAHLSCEFCVFFGLSDRVRISKCTFRNSFVGIENIGLCRNPVVNRQNVIKRLPEQPVKIS